MIFFIELQGVFGDVSLTSHRLIWSKRSCDHDLNLSLSTVLLVEDEEGSLMSSDKIILTLIDPTTSQQVQPVTLNIFGVHSRDKVLCFCQSVAKKHT